MIAIDAVEYARFAVDSDFINWLRNWDWDWSDLWAWLWGVANYHITAHGIWGWAGVIAVVYVALYSWEVTRPFINLTNAFLFRSIAGAATSVVALVGGGTLVKAKELFISMARRLGNWLKEQRDG